MLGLRLLALLLWLLSSISPGARAEPPPARVPQPEDILPQSELDDPIGLDRESRGLERAAQQQAKTSAPAVETKADRARFGPEPPPLDVRKGEVLTAAPTTREVTHRVQVELDPGLASVRVEMSFESRSQKASELRYRLAVPSGSRLAGLEVCNARACRQGLSEPASGLSAYDAALLARGGDRPLPVAHAANSHDARGDFITVRAAPVSEGQPLTVRVGYLSPAPMHGGVVRLTLPGRGMDPQVAPSEVKVSAARLLDPRVGGAPVTEAAASFDPWTEAPLQARARGAEPVHASAWHVSCGAQHCARAELWGGTRPLQPVDLVLALDVSPSTEGPARGRLVAAISALLAAAPEGSRVRALAFASRAQALAEHAMEPSQVALGPFAKAIEHAELGSATRFESVLALSQAWLKQRKRGLRPLVVIVGDGGLTIGEARPFERARAAGIEVSAVNVSDRACSSELLARVLSGSGMVIDAGAEADAAARGHDDQRLGERLAALFAPTLAGRVSVQANGHRTDLGPLRAGELVSWRGLSGSSPLLSYGGSSASGRPVADKQRAFALGGLASGAASLPPTKAEALAAVDARDLGQGTARDWPERAAKGACDRRGPARRVSGLSSDAAPVALAEERVCKPPPKAEVRSGESQIGAGMPGDPLLEMLRQRIMPVARGCFRRDRAGRPDYAKRAVFVFTLADREVVDARVEGPIPQKLKDCLLASVDTLEVPRFSGTVRVRYPLVTESVPLPEQIDLRAGTAGNLDGLFGAPSATAGPPP